AAPDEPRELLPVEAQCLELFVVRAPEQRRAEAPIAGGNARIAFDGNPEHTRELAAHPRRFPLDVADLRERNRADERRFDRASSAIHGNGLELDRQALEVRRG